METITLKKSDLIWAPLPIHWSGKSETATGYGRKLRTRYKVDINHKKRRIYCACYSNVALAYVIIDGGPVKIEVEGLAW